MFLTMNVHERLSQCEQLPYSIVKCICSISKNNELMTSRMCCLVFYGKGVGSKKKKS